MSLAARPFAASRESTCADWLRVVEPYLAPSLVTAPARRRLFAAAAHLPGACMVALEARLAAGSETVDLSVRLHRA